MMLTWRRQHRAAALLEGAQQEVHQVIRRVLLEQPLFVKSRADQRAAADQRDARAGALRGLVLADALHGGVIVSMKIHDQKALKFALEEVHDLMPCMTRRQGPPAREAT